ncbi:MAG: hypothetical protein PHU42_00460 [Patescibacteria group bacterium]|nr:hypothetical protein [Patescibacteria group bacterium]
MNEIPEDIYFPPFERPPFKKLESSGIHRVLKTPKGNDNLLVKEIPLFHQNPEEVTIEYNKKRQLFKDFSKRYDINAPDVNYVIGPISELSYKRGEYGSSLYQVKDKIHGIEFNENEKIPGNIPIKKEELPKFKEDTENLLASLSRYFLDTYKEDGLYMDDIFRPRQYVYGKRNGETKNEMYLVDVDDFKSFPENNVEKRHCMEDGLIDLAKMIVYFEEYLGRIKLGKARDELSKTTESILDQEPYSKEILYMVANILNPKNNYKK